jgi:tRNA pseudouridine55 synthase
MERPTSNAAVGGVLLVDKPAGLTSLDVVARVRRVTRIRRVGHTGTLDPFATGLLVLLLGRGTRLIPFIEGEPKVYEAVIRFGVETETDDGTGAAVRTAAPPSDVAIAEGIARLTGDLDQLPPSYSAKQVGGRRAYAAARAGAPLALEPARVTVERWELRDRVGDDLHVRITCGSGTYIRALARDLGRFTDSAAHLAVLRRVRSGPFEISNAVTLDDVEAGAFTLAPLRAAIPTMPAHTLDAVERARIAHGNAIDDPHPEDRSHDSAARAPSAGPRIALLEPDGSLIAVADRERSPKPVLRPRLVLADADA